MKSNLSAPEITVHIRADKKTIAMGKTVQVEAVVETNGNASTQDFILLPFVNQRRWGAHERPNAQGKAFFSIPLPNPGPAHLQVLALKSDTDEWMGLKDHDLLMAGYPMPDGGTRSNLLPLEVTRRSIPTHEPGDSLFCMQWEMWFTSGPRGWRTAQCVPAIGFYDTFNPDSIRQHMLWFMDMGVDFIMLDWSNHIWGRQHWSERSEHVNMLLHATQMSLEVLASLRDEGLPVPKVVLMPGLSNGRPCTMEALNEELDWIYQSYYRTPRFNGLWQEFEGKPLVIILDTGAIADKRARSEAAFRIPFFKMTLEMGEDEMDAFRQSQGPVDDSHFTIRWLSSQNQTTRHHELGYWSWMDGVLDPTVTYKDGAAEVVTVTPTFFNALGWLDKSAYGRRGGTGYLETFKVALQHRPRVIQLHQFNEFTGQGKGHGHGPDHNIFMDTYNVELSDDLEPVSMTAPGYRDDKGGWGYYYLNLTQALMDLYRHKADDCTLLAVDSPVAGITASGDTLQVKWSVLGKPARHFSIAVDGKVAKRNITGTQAEISLAGLAKGAHTLVVTAVGAVTRYPLSWTQLDTPLVKPQPVRVKVPLFIQ